jgi:hypothetical protein
VKVRLRNDTMRIRLSQTEVRRLGDGHLIESATHFGPREVLAFRVLPAAELTARLDGSAVELHLPAGELRDWATGDELTFEREQVWSGGSLKISLEKDLECRHPRKGDDDSDAFPSR